MDPSRWKVSRTNADTPTLPAHADVTRGEAERCVEGYYYCTLGLGWRQLDSPTDSSARGETQIRRNVAWRA